jgi:hypothetical protein
MGKNTNSKKMQFPNNTTGKNQILHALYLISKESLSEAHPPDFGFIEST